jgi:pimeloyl-ACP methyl ester carboxylesterase
MSTTGDPEVGASTPEAMAALQAPPPQTKEEAADAAVRAAKVIGSTGFPFDEERIRAMGMASFERARQPLGFVRQLAAIQASGDRTEALRSVRTPTLVIHGDADALLNVSGGRATAAAIPDARLLVIPGMGHDLPVGAWPAVVDAIADNAARSATV